MFSNVFDYITKNDEVIKDMEDFLRDFNFLFTNMNQYPNYRVSDIEARSTAYEGVQRGNRVTGGAYRSIFKTVGNLWSIGLGGYYKKSGELSTRGYLQPMGEMLEKIHEGTNGSYQAFMNNLKKMIQMLVDYDGNWYQVVKYW